MVVNRHHEAQFFHGPLKNYFQFPDGEPTTNVVEMAIEGLRPTLRATLQKAMAGPQPVMAIAPKVGRNGTLVAVRITVEPVPSQRGQEGLFLVSFTDETTEEQPAASTSQQRVTPAQQPSDQAEALRQLEDELQATRNDLQLTIEQLETANEELKASNEEVMSMNEELQSTNEELETSREELAVAERGADHRQSAARGEAWRAREHQQRLGQSAVQHPHRHAVPGARSQDPAFHTVLHRVPGA